MEDKSLIEILLDENNEEDIVLYDANDKATTFAQIAVIPIKEKLYVILKPIDEVEGVEDDEAIVFVLNEDDDENPIEICTDMDIATQVFEEYYKLLDEKTK